MGLWSLSILKIFVSQWDIVYAYYLDNMEDQLKRQLEAEWVFFYRHLLRLLESVLLGFQFLGYLNF